MNFINLSEHMLLCKEDRKGHLKLDAPCIEIGGSSVDFRGLLAHHLGTTCHRLGTESGILCHACHNSNCSNPDHLYWGNKSDNMLDSMNNGKLSVWESTVAKYGEKEAKERAKKAGSQGGKASRGGLTEEEVKRRLFLISPIDLTKFGWVQKVADVLGISHTKASYFVRKYYKGPTYKRQSPLAQR